MRIVKLKSIFLGMFILVVLSASAQPGNDNQQRGSNQNENVRGTRSGHMIEMLGLSDEQTKQIEKLRLENQKKMLPLRNELNEKEARMETLETAAVPDMKAINSLIDEMAVVKTKMAKEKAANHQEVRKLLNEDQRIKFDMQAGKRGMHEGKKGMHCKNGKQEKNCMQ